MEGSWKTALDSAGAPTFEEMGRGQNDGSSLLYGAVVRAPRKLSETPMQRATQIIHFTCADIEDPLASFSDAVTDFHHFATHHGVDWDAALAEGDAVFARERDRDWSADKHSQAELMEVCEESLRALDPDWDSGLSDEEGRIERAEKALEDITGPNGVPVTSPAAKVSEGLGCLRFAAERYSVDWDGVVRKAESYYRSDVDGF